MLKLPIRTITLGLADPHPLSSTTIASARNVLQAARERYIDAGYEVQTVRLSTRPVLDDLIGWSSASILGYASELQHMLHDVDITYCSLGSVFATRPDFPLAQLELVADLLVATDIISMTVHLATSEHGLRFEAAPQIARIMQRLAHETPEGFGNFRFAMLACVEPGGPFFPAAYHDGPSSLSIGLQGASLLLAALRAAGADASHMLAPTFITNTLRVGLLEQATPLVALGQRTAQDSAILFRGIDLSPAPMAEESIGAALELCGYGRIGSPGTLTVASAVTEALKSTGLPTCGYNGLMLPILEDVVLGRRWEEGRINVQQLLLYSTVCGTGLDTIPLSGASSVDTISRLLVDVATLSLRYQKPLSARLFPIPGRQAGEYTAFTSPYLSNTRVGLEDEK
ncbi:MAG: DUF711 family protein [Ktedonobacteraceae bacterium]|nr:DUF711 family protein [Ktedonobacteraceae bacterium]